MYSEMQLSAQAKQIYNALVCTPPCFDEADSLLGEYTPSPEEMAKIALDIVEECCYNIELSLEEKIDANSTSDYLYRIMQFLLKHGYNPNIKVDDDCAMFRIPYIFYGDLSARLMRLLLSNGGDANLDYDDGETLFDAVNFRVAYDECFNRATVYCWLVMMAYGGRRSYDNSLPLKMCDGLDVSIFKNFEEYQYYEIKPTKQKANCYGCWQMRIYETYEDVKRLVAVYGDVKEDEVLSEDTPSSQPDQPIQEESVISQIEYTPVDAFAFLEKIADMYGKYKIANIRPYMEPDFHYSSFWVFSEIISAQEYIEYITAKVENLKKSKCIIKTELMVQQNNGEPCLVIQQGNNEPACLVVQKSSKGLISRMDMMPSNFYVLKAIDQ